MEFSFLSEASSLFSGVGFRDIQGLGVLGSIWVVLRLSGQTWCMRQGRRIFGDWRALGSTCLLHSRPYVGVRIQGTLGDVDPLNKVPFDLREP